MKLIGIWKPNPYGLNMVFIGIWKPNPYEIFKHKSRLGFGNQTPTKPLKIIKRCLMSLRASANKTRWVGLVSFAETSARLIRI
jgi:hypothetical protein